MDFVRPHQKLIATPFTIATEFPTWASASAARQMDADGNWTAPVAAPDPRNAHHILDNLGTLSGPYWLLEPTSCTNYANNKFDDGTTGAVDGSPGTLPTEWGVSSGTHGGLTRTLTKTTWRGLPALLLRLNGTPTSTFWWFTLYPAAAAAASGQIWTAQAWIGLTAGNVTHHNNGRLRVAEVDTGGNPLATSTSTAVWDGLVLGAEPTLFWVTRTFNNASTTRAGLQLYMQFDGTGGSYPIDCTFLIAAPMLFQGGAQRLVPIINTTTAGVFTADPLPTKTVAPSKYTRLVTHAVAAIHPKPDTATLRALVRLTGAGVDAMPLCINNAGTYGRAVVDDGVNTAQPINPPDLPATGSPFAATTYIDPNITNKRRGCVEDGAVLTASTGSLADVNGATTLTLGDTYFNFVALGRVICRRQNMADAGLSALNRRVLTATGPIGTLIQPLRLRLKGTTAASAPAAGLEQTFCVLTGPLGIIEVFRRDDRQLVVAYGTVQALLGVIADSTAFDLFIGVTGAPRVDYAFVGTDALGGSAWGGTVDQVGVI